MTSNGTKRKTSETKEKKALRSKPASTSLATRKASLPPKNAKGKSASSSPAKHKAASSRSSSLGAGKPAASSRPGQRRAKNEEPTWDDDGWETEGWSEPRRITPKEHAKIRNALDENGKPRVRVMGRPRKASDDLLHSKPFRISKRFEEAFRRMATENGFKSWQEWLRTVGAREAGLLIETT